MSKEDQEEAAQAKINLENDAKLAKNEEALKNSIEADEKNKADVDAAIREGVSEGLEPTIAKAEEDRSKTEKKEEKESKKIQKDNTKTLTDEAKATDKAMKTEFKNEFAGASLKAYPKASLAQKTQKKKVIKLNKQ